MEAPENTPTEIARIMTRCWYPKPEDRPTFTEIHGEIDATFRKSMRESGMPDVHTPYINLNSSTENDNNNNYRNITNNTNDQKSEVNMLYHNV